MQQWIRFYFQLPLFIRLLATVLIMMSLFGLVIHLVEPANFPTLFDGIWWAFVTGATVGYGDYVPLSTPGKIIAILLILTGGGLVTFYMATLSASTVKHEQDLSEGKVHFKGENHFLFIGWNERTRQLIDMITSKKLEDQMVLIDQSMNHFYQNLPNVHFIHGDATDEVILQKANTGMAKIAIVTADPSKLEQHSDQSVIHQIVALKGHHPDLFIIAEVLTERQRINAERAGANTVIRSNDFMSSLFFHELYRNDPVQPFQLLLQLLTTKQFHEEQVTDALVNQPLTAAMNHYSENHWQLIGLRKNGQVSFDIHHKIVLEENDRLLFICPLRE